MYKFMGRKFYHQGQERQNVNDRYRLFVGSSYFIISFLFS